jgi:hypothetical protein
MMSRLRETSCDEHEQNGSLGGGPELINMNHAIISNEDEIWQHCVLYTTDQVLVFQIRTISAVAAILPAMLTMLTATFASMEPSCRPVSRGGGKQFQHLLQPKYIQYILTKFRFHR